MKLAATEQMSAGSEEVAASVIGIADMAKDSSEQTKQIRELTGHIAASASEKRAGSG